VATAELNLNIEAHASVDVNPAAGAVRTHLSYLNSVLTYCIAYQVNVATSAGASGCASLNGGIDITVGAKGTIKPIFDKEVTYSIFNKELEVFNVRLLAPSPIVVGD
jgi:hypothetical protein